jgi:hypothetical protein
MKLVGCVLWPQALLNEMDTDGKPDGRISLKEFLDWWMKEFGACSLKDNIVKAVLRLWLKVTPSPLTKISSLDVCACARACVCTFACVCMFAEGGGSRGVVRM